MTINQTPPVEDGLETGQLDQDELIGMIQLDLEAMTLAEIGLDQIKAGISGQPTPQDQQRYDRMYQLAVKSVERVEAGLAELLETLAAKYPRSQRPGQP